MFILVHMCVRAGHPGCHPLCLELKSNMYWTLSVPSWTKNFLCMNSSQQPYKGTNSSYSHYQMWHRGQGLHCPPNDHVTLLCSVHSPKVPFPCLTLLYCTLEFLEGRYCVSFVPVPSSCTMHDTGWALNEWVSESMNALMFKIKGNYFLTVCPFDFYCLIPLWWYGSSGMIVWTRCVIGISFRAEGGWAQPIKSEGLSCF